MGATFNEAPIKLFLVHFIYTVDPYLINYLLMYFYNWEPFILDYEGPNQKYTLYIYALSVCNYQGAMCRFCIRVIISIGNMQNEHASIYPPWLQGHVCLYLYLGSHFLLSWLKRYFGNIMFVWYIKQYN